MLRFLGFWKMSLESVPSKSIFDEEIIQGNGFISYVRPAVLISLIRSWKTLSKLLCHPEICSSVLSLKSSVIFCLSHYHYLLSFDSAVRGQYSSLIYKPFRALRGTTYYQFNILGSRIEHNPNNEVS